MKNTLTSLALNLVERGIVPDALVRHGIRTLVQQRLESLTYRDHVKLEQARRAFVEMMNHSTVAPLPEKANEQHYEVPAEFFRLVLGKHQKYSCCYWTPATPGLDQAEAEALRLTAERAQLSDGQRVLELGCGWGSLTLWMARHFPGSQITAVSNSHSQRRYIEVRANSMGLDNVRIITADMNDFSIDGRFDRVVSVEMFEHMRNYRVLFERISHWLERDGRFFMHIFCHRDIPYEFVDRDADDWMSRYFFSGGIMPSEDLPYQFNEHLEVTQKWTWNGGHYQKTAEAWLSNMEWNRHEVVNVLSETYGREEARKWWSRWRMFFMACSELFGYQDGEQWRVAHYLLAPKT